MVRATPDHAAFFAAAVRSCRVTRPGEGPGKVDAEAIKNMQEVETGLLLNTALAVELIDAVQHRKLDQMRLDRNLCAHPSLSPLGDVFAPAWTTPGPTWRWRRPRSLVHAPSRGRRVVDRIRDLLAHTAFIGEDFIAQTYFDRVKPAVRRRLVTVYLLLVAAIAAAISYGFSARRGFGQVEVGRGADELPDVWRAGAFGPGHHDGVGAGIGDGPVGDSGSWVALGQSPRNQRDGLPEGHDLDQLAGVADGRPGFGSLGIGWI